MHQRLGSKKPQTGSGQDGIDILVMGFLDGDG